MTRRTPAPPAVVLVDGDAASGMATMLAGLLEDNTREFRGRARVAARARGAVVLRALDADLAVTLSFVRGGVELRDGEVGGAPIVTGPWLTLAKVCSGRRSPVRAVAARELRLQPGRHLPAAAAAGYVLSVPASFYEERRLPRRLPAAAVAAAAIAGAAALAAWRVHRARAVTGQSS